MDEIQCFYERPESQKGYVTLTYAQSLDGCIAAGDGGEQLTLSSPSSFTMTHGLRSRHEAIAVGVGTILSDNPSLTTRLVKGHNPQPIVFDSCLRCPPTCKLLTDSKCRKPILVCAPSLVDQGEDESNAFRNRREVLEQSGASIWECKSKNGHLDLEDALARVSETFKSAMVEGGAQIISAILRGAAQRYVTSVVLTIAPKFVGGLNAIQWPSNRSTETAQENSNCRLNMELVQLLNMEGDIVVCYKTTLKDNLN